MARIQILPLPTVKSGDYERTPFILILDQAGDDERWSDEHLALIRHQTGAASVIAHAGTLDAPGQLEFTDEQRDQLLAYITQPQRIMLGQDIDPDIVPDTGRMWVVPDTATITHMSEPRRITRGYCDPDLHMVTDLHLVTGTTSSDPTT